jgi:hypothetical protein
VLPSSIPVLEAIAKISLLVRSIALALVKSGRDQSEAPESMKMLNSGTCGSFYLQAGSIRPSTCY